MSSFNYPLTPNSPDWLLSWDFLLEHDWLQPLVGCMQDEIYHAEGDVATHTRMVCGKLAELDEWRQLDATARTAVFLGALLHDIGKPYTTQETADGRIASPGHTKKGAHIARRILWRGDSFLHEPPPFAVREMVANLVRYSGLPIWFWHKAEPAREVIAASMRVRCDWLALMAEADCLGRASKQDDDFLERVALFRDFIQEQNCVSAPKSFASSHTRFKYFHSGKDLIDYELFDDTLFEVILMSGLPGAGKDSWVEANAADMPCISLDQIRRELSVDPSEPQSEVANEGRSRARNLLRSRTNFVWNATNISKSVRASLISFFAEYKARVRIVYVEPPTYLDLLDRNQARGDEAVPEHIIERLADRLEPPDITEAHVLDLVVS